MQSNSQRKQLIVIGPYNTIFSQELGELCYLWKVKAASIVTHDATSKYDSAIFRNLPRSCDELGVASKQRVGSKEKVTDHYLSSD